MRAFAFAAAFALVASAPCRAGDDSGTAGRALVSCIVSNVPHVVQKPDFCGEACVEMWTRRLGYGITQDDVFNIAGVDAALGRGCWAAELAGALKRLKFNTGEVWTKLPKEKRDEAVRREFAAMHADLLNDIPSIVCMRVGPKDAEVEHFRLVIGYDADAGEVVYHDPGFAGGASARMKTAEFMEQWPINGGGEGGMLVRLRLECEEPVQIGKPPGRTAADYCRHVMGLKKKLPDGKWTIVIARPFVVVGNEDAATVRRRADATVKWAAEKLKAAYFKKDPGSIIDVWLFKDDADYRKYALELFGDKPSTPYGYSSSEHNALVMNIATGGGTLVHEMVHPFMAANFPECPSWFNEGMGSLYEQSGSDATGGIMGLTNWRLAGLQRVIRAGRLPSFKELCSTTSDEFYGGDRGDNYAQARYLCYYLQEKGLLKDYFRKFVENHKADPTGYDTLRDILGKPDMAKFQETWEKYVLSLRFLSE